MQQVKDSRSKVDPFELVVTGRAKRERTQLNIDLGQARLKAFKAYCYRKGVSMVECMRQLVDFVLRSDAHD